MALLVRPFFLDRITEYPRRILILAAPRHGAAAMKTSQSMRQSGAEAGGGKLGCRCPSYRPASQGSL